ncbi:ankyrin repeat-containing domain protein [Aspergillus cavernicola]|uniref:Ankyrin repeat-containing domain protein n=1 Tax=Aspergillus cavernicola TaxID=176166 RepID=A0ABR4IXP3_9EURO
MLTDESGADVNTHTDTGKNALSIIVPFVAGSQEIITALLAAGASLTAPVPFVGRYLTPLQLAIQHAAPNLPILFHAWVDQDATKIAALAWIRRRLGKLRWNLGLVKAAQLHQDQAIEFLLSLPNMDYEVKYFTKSLNHCIQRSSLENTAVGILSRIPPGQSVDNHWPGILDDAVKAQPPAVVSIILDCLRSDINLDRFMQGDSALAIACYNNHPDIVQYLIAAGADTSVSVMGEIASPFSPEHQHGPLLHATRHGYTEIVTILLDLESDVNSVDPQYHRSLLSWAAGNGHLDTVHALLSHSRPADLHQADDRGHSAIFWAAANGHASTISSLLVAGAVVDAVNIDNQTPLILAIAHGIERTPAHLQEAALAGMDPSIADPEFQSRANRRCEVAGVLLQSGADAGFKDGSGRSALSHAAGSHQEQTVQMLLGHGVELDELDDQGRTALAWACLTGARRIAQVLVAAGCDRTKTGALGNSPLQLATDDYIVGILCSGP